MNFRARSIALAGLAAIASAASALAAPTLDWDRAFDATRAEPRVYADAHYADANGREHRLRLWRDADQRVRRQTDDRVAVYASRGERGELQYAVLDLERRLMIRVSRTNLYRIGVFDDWDGLAHLLARPQGVVAIAAAPASERASAEACTWYRITITAQQPAMNVCWSKRWGLALEIRIAGEPHARMQVDDVHAFAPDEVSFDPAPQDFAQIDADRDIDPTAD